MSQKRDEFFDSYTCSATRLHRLMGLQNQNQISQQQQQQKWKMQKSCTFILFVRSVLFISNVDK